MAIQVPEKDMKREDNSSVGAYPPAKAGPVKNSVAPEQVPATHDGEGNTSPDAPSGKEAVDPLAFSQQVLAAAVNPIADKSGENEGRDREDFFSGVVVRPEDVGMTLTSLIKNSENGMDPVTMLSEVENRMLDDLLAKGFTTHDIFLKKGFPVGFRTVNTAGIQRGYDILAPMTGSRDKQASLFTDMVVATYLNYYGEAGAPLHFSHRSKTAEEFTSVESLTERFNYVREKLDTSVVNTLLRRIQDFIEVTKRATRVENIVNF